jgi:hypothetical protein
LPAEKTSLFLKVENPFILGHTFTFKPEAYLPTGIMPPHL